MNGAPLLEQRKGVHRTTSTNQFGITPAYAGEKRNSLTSLDVSNGAPPRVRGKGTAPINVTSIRGITPACAGKSLIRPYSVKSSRDHPRVCGEKPKEPVVESYSAGSPPRVRGKVAVLVALRRHLGITPACAGKRQVGSQITGENWDHPRVCGEKSRSTCLGNCRVGSPPRVRGKAVELWAKQQGFRITPACAGKSPLPLDYVLIVRDHPRVCGEKRLGETQKEFAAGSPPRVRGKASRCRSFPRMTGITPACAGKRLPLS